MRKASTIKIGETLQKLRKSFGYTQEKLAEEIEVSTRYIGDIEQDRAKPSYGTLSQCSKPRPHLCRSLLPRTCSLRVLSAIPNIPRCILFSLPA